MGREESKHTRALNNYVANCNGILLPFTANIRSYEGIPDRYCIHKTWNGFIEFKDDTARLTRGQEYMLDRMLYHRVPSLVGRFWVLPNRDICIAFYRWDGGEALSSVCFSSLETHPHLVIASMAEAWNKIVEGFDE